MVYPQGSEEMIKKFNFRQKILLSQILLFLFFVAIAFPLVKKTVNRIVFRAVQIEQEELISRLKQTSDLSQMLQMLKQTDDYIFYRVSLYNAEGDVYYDTQYGILFGAATPSLYPTQHPEVLEALQGEPVYYIGQGQYEEKTLAYVIEAFDFHGKQFILRAAFPYSQMQVFSQQFYVLFIVFSLLGMLFFGGVTWLVLHRVNYPIRQIIKVIEPFQLGQQDFIQEIVLSSAVDEKDDFYRLAQTLNALSARLRIHLKNITEERNEKEAILESLGEGVIAVDSDMIVRYINFIGSKMIGIPKRNLIAKPFPVIEGKPFSALLEKCRFLLKTCQERMCILTDSLFIGEIRKVYLDLIAAPKAQGNGAIIVLQDKSSQYRVLEMGKDFVANASHELRTPITIIRGFAETLQDIPDMPKEMLSDITEKIVRNCQRMDSLVKNLLTLADIENLSENRFQECDLVALAENCRQAVRAVYGTAEIVIKKSRDAINVFADPDIFELAIINLLDNACKYSNPPASIIIAIDQVGDEVQITISDKGIGIPPGDLEHIFERFFTVDKARSRRLGGAGLGLSLVKTIIEKHQGTISVSSILGEGTTFTIQLPVGHAFHRSGI